MTNLTVVKSKEGDRKVAKPRRNSVFTAIDLNRDGKQIGYFNVPQSPNDDAWGAVQVPLAVVKNGQVLTETDIC